MRSRHDGNCYRKRSTTLSDNRRRQCQPGRRQSSRFPPEERGQASCWRQIARGSKRSRRAQKLRDSLGDGHVVPEKREQLPPGAMRIHDDTSARKPGGVRSSASSRLAAPVALPRPRGNRKPTAVPCPAKRRDQPAALLPLIHPLLYRNLRELGFPGVPGAVQAELKTTYLANRFAASCSRKN